MTNIKDQDFVLFECVNKVGPTEDVVETLLAYGLHLTSRYRFSKSDDHGNGQMIIVIAVQGQAGDISWDIHGQVLCAGIQQISHYAHQ